MDIISMAQQASPKPRGQIELRRAQFTALSSVVKMMPSSSSSLPKSSGLVRVTFLPRDVLIGPRTGIFAYRMGRDNRDTAGDGESQTCLRVHLRHWNAEWLLGGVT